MTPGRGRGATTALPGTPDRKDGVVQVRSEGFSVLPASRLPGEGQLLSGHQRRPLLLLGTVPVRLDRAHPHLAGAHPPDSPHRR